MPRLRRPTTHLLIALAAAAAAALTPAAGASVVPGEVVIDRVGDDGREPEVIRTADVPGTIARLRASGSVRYAVPNVIARATETSRFVPDDPGRVGRTGGWRATQWYLDGPFSINAPGGWANLIAASAPGATGVKVAILDSGVAYRSVPPRPASPELPRARFVKGYDFIDGDDLPLDEFGHGTIVAAILGGETDNGRGLAGVAYRSRLMPVRVLDAAGDGDATTIARGIRFAVRGGAQIINMSLEFPAEYTAKDIPQVIDALELARRRGVTVVAAAGNSGLDQVPYPGRAQGVIAVGATTERGCVADYSNNGSRLDLVAPGGGNDGEFADTGCDPARAAGRGITQITLVGASRTKIGLGTRDGTSMAAPQVSAAAAAVIASGVLGRRPSPAAIERRLKKTARDLGPTGFDQRYGHGMIDLAAATARP